MYYYYDFAVHPSAFIASSLSYFYLLIQILFLDLLTILWVCFLFVCFGFFKINLFYLFIFGCVGSARGLSLLAASGDYSLLLCVGFSLRWLLLLQTEHGF